MARPLPSVEALSAPVHRWLRLRVPMEKQRTQINYSLYEDADV